MTIAFNNGKEIEVDEVIVKQIADKIFTGAKHFMMFYDNDEIILIINIGEISYIKNS